MTRFVAKRLLQSLLVLPVVPTFVFATGRMIGDPAVRLPAPALAVRPIGRVTQPMRSAMVDELSGPCVDTLRARSLSETRIVLGHALENAAIPVVTAIGDETLRILRGAVVIEIVFARPGIGSLLVTAPSIRDLPPVEASVFVLALRSITVDLLDTRRDPRPGPAPRSRPCAAARSRRRCAWRRSLWLRSCREGSRPATPRAKCCRCATSRRLPPPPFPGASRMRRTPTSRAAPCRAARSRAARSRSPWASWAPP